MHFKSKVLKKYLDKAVQMDCLMYKSTAVLTHLPGHICDYKPSSSLEKSGSTVFAAWWSFIKISFPPRWPFLITFWKSENTLVLIKQMNLCVQSESKRAKVKKPNTTSWWTPAFPGNDLLICQRWFLHYLTTKNQSWIVLPVKSWSLCNGEENVPQTLSWKFHAHSDKGSQIL